MSSISLNVSACLRLKWSLLAGVATLVASVPGAAIAQEAAETSDNPADSIIVTGFRESLSVARDIKRDSTIQVDAIVAEDMAKFPELNLAESLQRIPGVAITREAGEGRRISLRGLGPDFSRVQLNGMEVLGNVDSAMDSRGQRSRDRAFDFNIFASELFSKVQVEKTYQVAQNEGGMAGTVGLFTGKPFDYDAGLKGAVSGKLGTNQYTEDAQTRLVGMLSQNWDNTFGVLVSVAYSKRQTTEQGHNTYNYTTVNGSQMADMVARGLDISGLSQDQQDALLDTDNTFYFADGNRISSWNSRQERLGITGALQWQANDDLLLTLDVLHGEYTTHRNEYHLATRPMNSRGSIAFDTAANPTAGFGPLFENSSSTINDIAWDNDGYVTYLDVTGTTFGSEYRRSLNKNKFNQVALTGQWDVSEGLSIDGHIGYEKSKYDTPYDDKFYMRAKGNLIADYGSDGRSVSFQYPGWDPTDASNYVLDNFYYRSFHNSSELREGVLNLKYEMTPAVTLRAGGAYHRFRQDGADYFYDANVNGTTDKMRGDPVTGVSNVFSNDFGSWLIGDYAAAFDRYDEYHRLETNADGTGGALQDIENVYTTTEETIAGYLQMDWDTELFGKRVRGNAGLRAYRTKTHSTGWIQGDSYAYLGTTDVDGEYSGVLPALNAVMEMDDHLLLRFAATQNLNRPGLGSMAAEGSAFQDESTGYISASRGNPDLKPYKDTTLDFAVEYYFGDVGLLSAGVFQKWIKNFITSETYLAEDGNGLTFAEAGIPASTIPGATPDTVIDEFSMPTNLADTKSLTGFELAAQAGLSFLPAPLDNLGVIANLTVVDAPREITGVSKTSYNATVYYETKRWGARASLSHRSRYYTGWSDTKMSASTRGFEPTTYVDASFFYNIINGLQLTVNAINITNQKETQFWGQNRYLYNQTQSGTTYMAGLALKF